MAFPRIPLFCADRNWDICRLCLESPTGRLRRLGHRRWDGLIGNRIYHRLPHSEVRAATRTYAIFPSSRFGRSTLPIAPGYRHAFVAFDGGSLSAFLLYRSPLVFAIDSLSLPLLFPCSAINPSNMVRSSLTRFSVDSSAFNVFSQRSASF